MKKRIGSLLLILALCFTLLPTAAFAADSTAAWDGTADISWYTDHETDTEYRFTTAEQLAGMAKLINDDMANFKDKTIYLENDLDLGGHEWISIGDGANTDVGSFQGVFDGQSHVIYNLYANGFIEGINGLNRAAYDLLHGFEAPVNLLHSRRSHRLHHEDLECFFADKIPSFIK